MDGFAAIHLGYDAAVRGLGLLAPRRLGAWLGPQSRVVLDLGGGTGLAADALPGRCVIVLDPSPAMLRHAGARRLLADGGRIPCPDRAFDAVLCCDVLHHAADPARLFAEAARVLRRGGRLVVREFDPRRNRARLLLAGEHLLFPAISYRTPAAWAALAERAGLRRLRWRRDGWGFLMAMQHAG